MEIKLIKEKNDINSTYRIYVDSQDTFSAEARCTVPKFAVIKDEGENIVAVIKEKHNALSMLPFIPMMNNIFSHFDLKNQYSIVINGIKGSIKTCSALPEFRADICYDGDMFEIRESNFIKGIRKYIIYKNRDKIGIIEKRYRMTKELFEYKGEFECDSDRELLTVFMLFVELNGSVDITEISYKSRKARFGYWWSPLQNASRVKYGRKLREICIFMGLNKY